MAEAYGPTYCTSAHVLESKLSHKPEAQYGFVPKLIHHGGKTPCFALKNIFQGLIYKTFAVIVDVSTDTRRIKTSEEGFLRFLLTTETSKIKRLFSLTFLCLFALMAVAQDYTALVSGKEKKGSDTSLSRPLQAGVLFGVGYSNQLDTYLSPMEYTGYQLSFLTSRESLPNGPTATYPSRACSRESIPIPRILPVRQRHGADVWLTMPVGITTGDSLTASR